MMVETSVGDLRVDRQLRFAYLCCDFGVPISGTKGAAVHVRETAKALRRLGHIVKIFSPTPGADTLGEAREQAEAVPLDGFAEEVVRLASQEPAIPQSHLAKEWRALLYAEYIQKALLPVLREFQPDVIYERYSLFGYAGAELARRLQVPFLLEVNAPLRLEQAKYRQLVLTHTAEELEGRILNSADALIVVSRALAEYACGLGVPAHRITVLPNGVNPQRFHPAVSGVEVRSRYNLNGKSVIGFVGSLKPWHDLDTLRAAVTHLAAVGRNVHLLVVGEGPKLGQLNGLKTDYVTCTGAVHYKDVPAFMAAMDVVVAPYPPGCESYFSPLKLFEAMAMGKPVVGARIGQIAEVVVDEVNGLLYEPGDADHLAGGILAILQMPDRGAALGAAARRWVLSEQTWEQNAGRIAQLAESLLMKAGTRG